MSGATDRVREYLESRGITKYAFYKATGFSNKFLDNSSNMGTDRAEIILRHYSDISPEWLVMGTGPMLRGEQPAISVPMGAPPPDPVDVSGRDPRDIELIAAQKQTIAAQARDISHLERDVKHLEKDVEHLEGRIVDKENQLKDCEKSAADDAVTIASLTRELAKYKNATDDGATNTETSGSEALGDAHCLGDAECFAVGEQSI